MGISKFWFYTLMIAIVLHVVIVFVYLIYKLSTPKKNTKKDVQNTTEK